MSNANPEYIGGGTDQEWRIRPSNRDDTAFAVVLNPDGNYPTTKIQLTPGQTVRVLRSYIRGDLPGYGELRDG